MKMIKGKISSQDLFQTLPHELSPLKHINQLTPYQTVDLHVSLGGYHICVILPEYNLVYYTRYHNYILVMEDLKSPPPLLLVIL